MDIAVREPEVVEPITVQPAASPEPINEVVDTTPVPATAPAPIQDQTPVNPTDAPQHVSALSLSSIRAKRELERNTKAVVRDPAQLPTEPFTETDMLLQWTKYAQRLGDRGHKIMESLLLINDPKLDGTTIIHELPNEGSKIDFEGEKFELLGYLRGKLHNHDISIEIVVNEQMDSRKAFTPQDKFNRLNELNPTLDLLRKTFDLDL